MYTTPCEDTCLQFDFSIIFDATANHIQSVGRNCCWQVYKPDWNGLWKSGQAYTLLVFQAQEDSGLPYEKAGDILKNKLI